MGRNAAGVYDLPATSIVAAGEVITASQFNATMADLRDEQLAERTIATGGTGADNASDARTNLGVTAQLALKRNTADEVPQAEVTGLVTALQTHTTDISGLQSTTASHTSSITTLTSTQATQGASITSLQSDKFTTATDTIPSSQISDFSTAVPPLAPIQSLVAGTNITITENTATKAFTLASTDTNTLYTAGSGLSLASEQFSVNSDQRGTIGSIGTSTAATFTTGTSYHAMYFGGAAAANEKFRFDSAGNFYADGDIIGFSTTISDPRLKKDIKPVTGALGKIESLNGYTYSYLNGKPAAGVLSTEVEQVFPSAVIDIELPNKSAIYRGVQYDQLHALLIEAVKELSARVKELETCRCKQQAK